MQMKRYYWFVGVKTTKEVYIVVGNDTYTRMRIFELMAGLLGINVNRAMEILSITLADTTEEVTWEQLPIRYKKWTQKEIIDRSSCEKE